MSRDLLKEAIADAKAVKETAIANAKAALAESFAPHLQELFATKINELDEEVEEGKEMKDAKKAKGKKEMEERLGTINDPEGSYEHGNTAESYGLEEMELEELLAELSKEKMDEEEVSEEETYESLFEEEEVEINDEEMSDDEMEKIIQDVIADMIEDGELVAGPNFEDEDEDKEGEEMPAGEEMPTGEEMPMDEEVNLDELLAEIKKEMAKETMSKKSKEISEEEMEESADKKKMKKELEEAYDTIKTLRSEMNEVNLLNAKLLYTNKVFRAKNLTESQKVKVLETFDKATTVKEVKLVFESLSFDTKPSKIVKNPIRESLGGASKAMNTSNTKRPILEVNEQFSRMQKLAGIIK